MDLKLAVKIGFVNPIFILIPQNYATQKARYQPVPLALTKMVRLIIRNANVTQTYILILYLIVNIF